MTYVTYPWNAVSIGEASRRAGVPVRTIRFYCDEGIVTAQRTTGGHRVFTPDAIERLMLIRRWRAVGLGLAAIAELLADGRATLESVATERAAVEAELGTLSWRHAVLLAIEQADGDSRATVLARLAAVSDRRMARTALIDFWRRILTAMPTGMFDDFVEMDIPPIPAAPAPRDVLAFAELAHLVESPELARALSAQLWRTDEESIRNKRGLITDLAAAHAAVANRVSAEDRPGPGAELDLFVAAHAAARGRRDTPGFRRELLTKVPAAHPAVTRYWALTAAALGTHNTTGAAQYWFHTALIRALEPSAQEAPVAAAAEIRNH